VDPNYVLISTPSSPALPSNAYIVNDYGFPVGNGAWYVSGYGDNAAWIAPQPAYYTNQSDAPGNYLYQTSFYIPAGFDPSTVLIYGYISSDNCTQQILVNGTAVVPTAGSGALMVPGTCSTQAHYFEIGGASATWESPSGAYLATATFRPGVNTLQFQVNNLVWTGQNPTGLVVWMQSEGMFDQPVPEASTAGLMAAALALAALLRRTRLFA
jgi:hypothetical protein